MPSIFLVTSFLLLDITLVTLYSLPCLKDIEEAGGKYRVLPLEDFIAEILKRTKISYSTLISALLLLNRLRSSLLALSQGEPLSAHPSHRIFGQILQSKNFVRRIFISSIVIATKFLQDIHPSNLLWSKVTGLSLQELNYYEVFFLSMIDHNVYISSSIFYEWSYWIYMQYCEKSEAKPDGHAERFLMTEIGSSILSFS